MAEFALGLTKTAVEGTVSRVKSAIDEETKLRVRVQNDLVFITGEFEMMQSFLNVANKERAKNEVVRTWVRQIRDLAFDVEDCVELVVSLDIKSGWSWLWRVLPSCMAPPQPLDQAVAEIQRLKARVEDVSHRNTRYNLIGDSGSSSKTSAVTMVSSPAPELKLSATTGAGASSSAFHILREVWEAAGKMRRDMGDLRKLITNEGSDLEVISLWGSPGSAVDLGTMSIIGKAYNDPETCQEFKTRAWVKLMHPFNLEVFLKSLLAQLYATSSHDKANLEPCFRTTEDYHLIKAELMKQVCEQRYLVIVEQLHTVAEWDAIRMYLPNSKNGSRIVVTTQQLGLALSFTEKPYQVTDLRQFSDGQSLCAFFKQVSGRRSDMAELVWQLRCGGVVSVWGCRHGESTLVDKVYTGITHKSKYFEGVEFDRHSWVDLPDPFDLGVFSRRLFFNLHSDDLRATKIAAAGVAMDNAGVIQGRSKFLHEDDRRLIVINGVNSTDDWDLIKDTFSSEHTKGCILVITMELSVARHCVKNEADRAPLNIKDLDADAVLDHSTKGCEYDGIGGKEASSRGRFFSDRMQEACDWINKFQLYVELVSWGPRKLLNSKFPGVMSLYGIAGKSVVARQFYYEQMLTVREGGVQTPRRKYQGEVLDFGFTKFSWVEVPHPFDLTDFSLRLLLDFHSDDIKAKETAAGGVIKGQDPIQGCRKFMLQHRCLVVINGLRSTDDWESIRAELLSSDQPSKSCILVITDEKSVATHCVLHQEDRVLLIKERHWSPDRSRDFYSRLEEAHYWAHKFELIGRRTEQTSLYGCQPEQISLHGRLDRSLNKGHVISVWGAAGVGKSTLAKTIYYNFMIAGFKYDSFREQDTRSSWVDVAESFNLTDLSIRLLMDFHWDGLEAKETTAVGMMEGQDPIQWCRDFLHQDKRFFVVIDGLRSTDDWDLIKAAFLAEPIKGYIVVITNEESIARHCVDEKDAVINVKALQADAALNLFTKIAWDSKQLTSEEVELSRLTTAKCGGLPKVIAAIGEYCRASLNKKWSLKRINDDFMGMLETNPSFHSLRGLTWMQSYFDDCPDSLKPCIFYMSVFPLGHSIRRRRLLRRWIAEGYSRDTPGSTAEENGEKYFSQLVKLSIIQQQQQQQEEMEEESPSNADVCQINGFFREYIVSRPMQDNLVFALEGRCMLNSQRVGRHLTISSSWDRDKIVFESMELSRLRSLTVLGKWRSFFVSANVSMRLLQVLDLEDTSGVTNDDMEQIGKLLPRLKFLSVRGCKDITRLPSSLGGMRLLQTLDIKGTTIVTLPPTIVKLEQLQYVRAGATRWISTSSEHDDGMVTSVATPPPADGDGVSKSEPPPPADGDGASTSQPPPPPPPMNGYGVSTSQPPPPMDGDGVSTSQPPTAPGEQEARTPTSWSSMPCGLVVGRLSKLHRNGLASRVHHGVQFPAAAAASGGIGKFTALHTLGVVNVSGAGGKAVLRELKKLTQLRSLKLSGINRKNWQDFCCTISGLGYLESLSVRLLDEEETKSSALGFACFGDISEPPKQLKALKVYGEKTRISPVWIKQLRSLTKADLELTVSTQEDMDALVDLPRHGIFQRICTKPIQDGELRFGSSNRLSWAGDKFVRLKVLKIDCSYKSEITFRYWIPDNIEVLVVHCSTTESSLRVSGLENLKKLREVWLKGSYSEEVKRHLQQKLAEHWNEPILKLEEEP